MCEYGPALDALQQYGVHKNDCKKWWHHQIEGSHLQENKECTCGLDKAIQGIKNQISNLLDVSF